MGLQISKSAAEVFICMFLQFVAPITPTKTGDAHRDGINVMAITVKMFPYWK